MSIDRDTFDPFESFEGDGFDAFWEGKVLSDCPYTNASEAGSWRLGWERAQDIQNMELFRL